MFKKIAEYNSQKALMREQYLQQIEKHNARLAKQHP